MKSQTLLKPPVNRLLGVFDRHSEKCPYYEYGAYSSSGYDCKSYEDIGSAYGNHR